jgi:uncharacterized membrane protein
MHGPTLFRDRSQPVQVLLGGVIPAVIGVVAGILLGVSSTGYWIVAVVAAVGGFVSGFEHVDGWGGADRGFFGGLFYGGALLLTHYITGKHAKVSLGSFPPLLPVVTAIVGLILGGLGGFFARTRRARTSGADASA